MFLLLTSLKSEPFLRLNPSRVESYLIQTIIFFKGALTKIFVKKILQLTEILWFVIKYISLNQTLFILKTFPSECILNRIPIFICLQASKCVHWVNEWKVVFLYAIFGEKRKKTTIQLTPLYPYHSFYLCSRFLILSTSC